MSALGKVVRAGVGRRRLQTLVMLLTTMMSVTASVLAAGLLVASQAPFDHAFAQQRGAHLTVGFDPARATAAQVAATARVSGVTAVRGPDPVLSLRPRIGRNHSQWPVDMLFPPMVFVGRADPGGPVDDLTLLDGRWATGPGEVVFKADQEPFNVGDQLDFPGLPGDPRLTVVGVVAAIGTGTDAWVSPQQIPVLTPPGSTPALRMGYRFRDAGTDAQVLADGAAVRAAVPAGSVTSAASYLPAKLLADRSSGEYVPFVTAFGVLGLCMSVLIIGIVVSGSVGAATRRIGILKALGFTPAQVVRGYLGQALIPAAVGTVLGVLLGNAAAVPVLNRESGALGAGSVGIAPWIDVAVPAVALLAVAATALAGALRAGRLRTVDALTVGRTPSAGRGRTVRALLGRLPLPRALSLGLAQPFARPTRSATMAAAVVLGTVGATFGVGLAISLNDVQHGMARRSPGAVVLDSFGAPPGSAVRTPQPGDVTAVTAKLGALPGTRRVFSIGQTQVGVAGLAGPTMVSAYTGDSSWGGYDMVAGRWFSGPGQAVVPSGFLTATGTRIGDTVTLTSAGRSAPVRIVGEAFDLEDAGMAILTDSASLAPLGTVIDPMTVSYQVDLTPGTAAQSYADAADTAVKAYGVTAEPGRSRLNPTLISMDALVGMLTLMLLTVAGLGVLHTVVLDTRERVHDFGVFKALGMAPRQTVAMVLTSVAGIGLLAGAVGVPLGVALHDAVLPSMGDAAGTRLPDAYMTVYHLPVLLPLLLGGLVIATVGALLPAGWAARTGTAKALRTE